MKKQISVLMTLSLFVLVVHSVETELAKNRQLSTAVLAVANPPLPQKNPQRVARQKTVEQVKKNADEQCNLLRQRKDKAYRDWKNAPRDRKADYKMYLDRAQNNYETYSEKVSGVDTGGAGVDCKCAVDPKNKKKSLCKAGAFDKSGGGKQNTSGNKGYGSGGGQSGSGTGAGSGIGDSLGKMLSSLLSSLMGGGQGGGGSGGGAPYSSRDTDSDSTDEDYDGDGIPDGRDNCVYDRNPGQEDSDGDGLGDVCDNDTSTSTDTGTDNADTDGDGVNDDVDNCPDVPNTDQEDSDNDGTGDACETGGDSTSTSTDDGDNPEQVQDNAVQGAGYSGDGYVTSYANLHRIARNPIVGNSVVVSPTYDAARQEFTDIDSEDNTDSNVGSDLRENLEWQGLEDLAKQQLQNERDSGDLPYGALSEKERQALRDFHRTAVAVSGDLNPFVNPSLDDDYSYEEKEPSFLTKLIWWLMSIFSSR